MSNFVRGIIWCCAWMVDKTDTFYEPLVHSQTATIIQSVYSNREEVLKEAIKFWLTLSCIMIEIL